MPTLCAADGGLVNQRAYNRYRTISQRQRFCGKTAIPLRQTAIFEMKSRITCLAPSLF
jgi:hypothetical protein